MYFKNVEYVDYIHECILQVTVLDLSLKIQTWSWS